VSAGSGAREVRRGGSWVGAGMAKERRNLSHTPWLAWDLAFLWFDRKSTKITLRGTFKAIFNFKDIIDVS
jgi:hypothetical protein